MKYLFLYSALAISLAACNNSGTATEDKKGTSTSQNVTDQKAELSSWSDGPRKRIEDWVKDVTNPDSKNFIPVTDRIAVFDNDGTLWPEQPVPNELVFAIDNIKALSATHPEFQKSPVLKGILDGDMEPLKKAGTKGLVELMYASHTNMTEDEFNQSVTNWIDTAKDKKFGKLYKDLLYQPMLELLAYLRANDFKTFIVSGGGVDFMRVWCEKAYGIPPNQVIGSYTDVKYEVIGGKPVITKLSAAPFVDDKTGKPVAIHRFIGKVPVFCGGNSDGDQAMMQYTSGSKYKTLCLIVHHTDADREYQYDMKTLSGHLETALVEAKEKNWMVVDMKTDFKKVFPFQ